MKIEPNQTMQDKQSNWLMIGYHKLWTTVARLCKMAGIAEQGYIIQGLTNS